MGLIGGFILVPFVGIYKSSLLFGLLNIAVGFATFVFFRKEIGINKLKSRIIGLLVLSFSAIIIFSLVTSSSFMKRWNNGIFKHPVVYHKQSPYQDITLTKTDNEFRMYLNGAIQFSSRDEYRYHEALVHIPMMQHVDPQDILLLGGGEGLAAREVLKYPVQSIQLVDIDPAIVELSSQMQMIKTLNNNAFASEKIQVTHADAFSFLIENEKKI